MLTVKFIFIDFPDFSRGLFGGRSRDGAGTLHLQDVKENAPFCALVVVGGVSLAERCVRGD